MTCDLDLEVRIQEIIQDIAIYNVLKSLLNTLKGAIEAADDILPGELIDAALEPIKLAIQRITEAIPKMECAIQKINPDQTISELAAPLNLQDFVTPVLDVMEAITAYNNIVPSGDILAGGSSISTFTPDAIKTAIESYKELTFINESPDENYDNEYQIGDCVTYEFSPGFYKVYQCKDNTQGSAIWILLIDTSKFYPASKTFTAVDFRLDTTEINKATIENVNGVTHHLMDNSSILHFGDGFLDFYTNLQYNFKIYCAMSSSEISKNIRLEILLIDDSNNIIKTFNQDMIPVPDNQNGFIISLDNILNKTELSNNFVGRVELYYQNASSNDHSGNLYVKKIEINDF